MICLFDRKVIMGGFVGAAWGRAENAVRQLVEATGLPFLPTPMGKGVVSDTDERFVNPV